MSVACIAQDMGVTRDAADKLTQRLVRLGWMSSKRRGRAKTNERFILFECSLIHSGTMHQDTLPYNVSSGFDTLSHNATVSRLSPDIYYGRIRDILSSTIFGGCDTGDGPWSHLEKTRFRSMLKKMCGSHGEEWLETSMRNLRDYMLCETDPLIRSGYDRRPTLMADFLKTPESWLVRSNRWRSKFPLSDIIPFKTQQNAS